MEKLKRTLLIVEDDEGLQRQLRWQFDQYNTTIVGNREDAIAALRQHNPAVVMQDLGLPPDADGATEGLRTLQEILTLSPNTKVIVVTGNQDQASALKAVSLGAYDYCEKPADPSHLELIVQRAYQMHGLEEKNRQLQQQQLEPLAGLQTCDAKMLQICRTIEKLAPTNITCLLIGESGTGKEVLARAVHTISPNKNNSFVAINCAAIPENLIESELFGYEKGAFTGAHKRTPGKIEAANKGTLFLDEIGDMPLHLQTKLLRFLQERVVVYVGGQKEIPIDTRVVCATNKDLKAMVDEGTFREDLYYRISEIQIDIPPLREREGDKILIARHFLGQYVEEQGYKSILFSDEAAASIESYDWPGNVRELQNKLKRAMIMCDGNRIASTDLGLNQTTELKLNLKQVRQDAEKAAINKALTLSNNNISETAKLLGITRPTLYDMLKKYALNTVKETAH
mgnify:CR=1 FL=1